jgi:flagellar assembly protein FliH
MSLSSGGAAVMAATGRIIIGPKSVGLAELTMNSAHQEAVRVEAEEDYLERVRTKARDMAKEILTQAMVEAEALRKQAREQGCQEGHRKAAEELKKITEQKGLECKALLESMRHAGESLWRSHRQDLTLLVQVMVEKILAVELESHRRESLVNLLDQAVDMMDVKRRVVITVHPRDQEMMGDLIRQARAGEGGLQGCKIKTDESIEPGGLLLECDHGMVDNTIAARRASLQDIVDQLTLEETS